MNNHKTLSSKAKEKVLKIQLEFEPNPIREAKRFADALSESGVTQHVLADLTGHKRSYIASSVRLLKLPTDVQLLISKCKLGVGSAKYILSLPTEMQSRVAHDALLHKWDARELETQVKKMRLMQSESKTLSQNMHTRSGLQAKLVTKETGHSFVTFAFRSEKEALEFLKKVENRVTS